MSNVSRPAFNPSTGLRIRYQNSPVYDLTTGASIVYGEDRSNPSAFDQSTGLPIGTTATVSLTNNQGAAAAASAPAAPRAPVTVTKVSDNAYEVAPVFNASAGLTITQIRSMYSSQLSLSNTMIALVNGEQAENNDTVEEGDAVVFKEPAKRRG